jgi:hypothetical protein
MVVNSPDALSIYKLAMAPGYLPIVMKIGLTSTAYNGVAWTGGVIKCADGSEFTAVAGNLTLANTSPYYLYYDTSVDNGVVSSTQVFTDTTSNERLLLAFLKQGPDSTRDAMIVPARGEDTLLPTIAASQIYATDLSAINADLGLITAGEIRLGTGTVGVNFTGWRVWMEGSPGSEIGKIGGFSSGAPQWYSDTNGKLYAGGGAVILDENGITAGGGNVIVDENGITVKGETLAFVYSFLSIGSIQQTTDGLLIGTASTSKNVSLVSGSGDISLSAASGEIKVNTVIRPTNTAYEIGTSTYSFNKGYFANIETNNVNYGEIGNSTYYWAEMHAGKYTAEASTGGYYCKGKSSHSDAYSNYAGIEAYGTNAACELWVFNGNGEFTQISPHDPKTGEWIFLSHNVKTGRTLRVNMEQLVKEVEELTNKKFMTDTKDKSLVIES